jgi:hypothetical protein
VANHHIEQDDPALFALHPVDLALERVPAMVAYEHLHVKILSKEGATHWGFLGEDMRAG